MNTNEQQRPSTPGEGARSTCHRCGVDIVLRRMKSGLVWCRHNPPWMSAHVVCERALGYHEPATPMHCGALLDHEPHMHELAGLIFECGGGDGIGPDEPVKKGSQQALDNLFLAAALEDEKGD